MRPMRFASTLLLAIVLALSACARQLGVEEALASAGNLVAAGEFGEARIVLKNLLVLHPGSAEARARLASIALASGDVRAADAELRAVTGAGNELSEVRIARLRTDLSMGRHAGVLTVLDGDKNLPARDVALLRGVALRASGRAADGLAALRAARDGAPDDQELAVEIASALVSIGNPAEAQRELDDFITRVPGAADALLARADLRLRQGAVDRARADAFAALKAAPASWTPTARHSAMLLLCEVELAEGRIAEASRRVEEVESRFPGSVGAQVVRGRIAILEGRDGDAIDILQSVLAVLPTNPRVHFLLVDSFVRSGNLARATEALERRLAAEPDDAETRRLLARLRLGQSRPDQVVSLLGGAEGAPETGQDRDSESLLSIARLARQQAANTILEMTAKRAARPNDVEVVAQLAAAHLQNGDPGKALATLAEVPAARNTVVGLATRVRGLLALASDRDLNLLLGEIERGRSFSAPALIAAADAAQLAGRVDVAARLVGRAAELAPDNIDVRLREANIAYVERRFDEAEAILQRLAQRKPAVMSAQIGLARIAEARGNRGAARSALAVAIAGNPGAPEPSLMLAALEMRDSRAEAAHRVLGAMVASAPPNGTAARAAGTLLFNARRYEEARTLFRTAVEQKPSSAEEWFNLGRAQFALQDFAAAGESWRLAANLQPDSVPAHLGAVRVALQQGDTAGAQRLAQGLVERLPENPIAWLLVGDAAVATRDWSGASRAFSRSYAIRPSAAAAFGDHRARSVGGLARAEQPIENWIARDPSDIAARRLLADFLIRSQRVEAAVAQLELLLARQPNDVASLNNMAWLLATRNSAAAEQYARRAYAIAPQNAAVADTLGWVLIQSRQFAEAATILEKAVAMQPVDPATRYHLALALARSGDRSAAGEQLGRALAQNSPFQGREAAAKLMQELSK